MHKSSKYGLCNKKQKKVHKSPWCSEKIPASHRFTCGKNPVRQLSTYLSWEGELLALEDLGDVQVEEVAVQNGLDDAGHDGDEVEEALAVVAVDPVEEVQAAVQAKSEQVVGGDGLCLASFADHEELGKDGDWFQVDGESPQDLESAELVVDQEGETADGNNKKLRPESVVVTVVGGLELNVNKIDGEVGATDVDALHCRVVQWDEVGEQVQVSSSEDESEQELRFSADSRATPGLPDFHQKQNDGQQVAQVPSQSEHIHYELIN